MSRKILQAAIVGILLVIGMVPRSFERCPAPGIIQLTVRDGYDVYQVLADHGDAASNLSNVFDPPFATEEIRDGFDRALTLRVPYGAADAKVNDYLRDRRVEFSGRYDCLVGRSALGDRYH